MSISKELLDILACPKCKGDIHLNEQGDGLICDACRLIAMNPTIVLATIQNRQRGRLSVKLQSRWLAWFLIAAELIS